MSDWNSLENQLRQWTPRPPSPELRTRIFSRAARVQPAGRLTLADFTQWLVPAFGCFLLMAGTLSSRYPAHASLPFSPTNIFGENGSAYTEMVIASGADHSDKNSLPAGRLEWSFGGRSGPANWDAAPVSYTNTIIQ